jgi:hypothetical protein
MFRSGVGTVLEIIQSVISLLKLQLIIKLVIQAP